MPHYRLVWKKKIIQNLFIQSIFCFLSIGKSSDCAVLEKYWTFLESKWIRNLNISWFFLLLELVLNENYPRLIKRCIAYFLNNKHLKKLLEKVTWKDNHKYAVNTKFCNKIECFKKKLRRYFYRLIYAGNLLIFHLNSNWILFLNTLIIISFLSVWQTIQF